jgi:hypothetical protein
MPGISGVDLAIQMRAQCPNCKILLFQAKLRLRMPYPTFTAASSLENGPPLGNALVALAARESGTDGQKSHGRQLH